MAVKNLITPTLTVLATFLILSCAGRSFPTTVHAQTQQQSNIVCAQGEASPISGNGSLQTLSSCTIKANTLGPGQCLNLTVNWEHTGTQQIGYRLLLGSTPLSGIHYSNGSGDGDGYGTFSSVICNDSGTQQSQFAVNAPRTYGTSIFYGGGLSRSTENLASDSILSWQFVGPSSDQVSQEGFVVQVN